MRRDPPVCDCVHKYSNGKFLPGSGNIDNPYIIERLDEGCITLSDGTVILPDEDGCAVLPFALESSCFATSDGESLEPDNANCIRLPFALDEHYGVGSDSLLSSFEFMDNTPNIFNFNNANETSIWQVGSVTLQNPTQTGSTTFLPQLKFTSANISGWSNTSLTQELTPLVFSINHSEPKRTRVQADLQFETDGVVKVTPYISVHNSEIPLSQSEIVEMSPLVLESKISNYTHRLGYTMSNTNTSNTHIATLGLIYEFTTATYVKILEGELSATFL